jgi:imidazolonepropionase-like amidohydrolase
MCTWDRFLFVAVCALAALWFLFELYLAVYILPSAVAVYALTLLTLLPPIRGKIRAMPLIKVRWFRGLVFLILLLAANGLLKAGDHAPAYSRANTAYVGATILTGHANTEAIEDGVVLVDTQGLIAAVGTQSSVEVPPEYVVVELHGKFLLPGLINAHDHLMMIGDRDPFAAADFSNYVIETPGGISEWILQTYPLKRLIMALMERNAVKALSGGVTTVRELATLDFLDVDLRRKIERGERIGPRILAAGPPLCITGGHGYQLGRVISGPVDARNAVREAIGRGVDVIKITSTGGVADSRRVGEAGELQMTPVEIRAVTDEAHRRNILVAAHVESQEGVLEALRAGVDSIEHGASLNAEAIELFLDNPQSLRGYTTLHPTLSVLAGGVIEDPAISKNSRLDVINTNAEIVQAELISGFKTALANGVHIGVGTDAGVIAHDSVWAEMKLFIEHGGVSNEQAIHMGTLATARSIGIDTITGSVDAGKAADLLVVSDDPRNDITALASPFMVVAQGVQTMSQRKQ